MFIIYITQQNQRIISKNAHSNYTDYRIDRTGLYLFFSYQHAYDQNNIY